MKIFISMDMEGVSGIVGNSQTSPDTRDYETVRRLMIGEANAAIEGALEGGATEVVVNDSHASMRNLLPDEVHPEARLITGSPKALSMMEGIDSTFDAVFLIGYHVRAGAHGVLNHTYSGRVVQELRINDVWVGETGMNAGIAGYYGVPVALVTGDSRLTAEARELLGDIETVAVKDPVGQYAAKCLHPVKAREAIKAGAIRAVKRCKEIKPYIFKPPVTFQLTTRTTGMADAAAWIPEVQRASDLAIRYTNQDFIKAFMAARAMIYLAGAAN